MPRLHGETLSQKKKKNDRCQGLMMVCRKHNPWTALEMQIINTAIRARSMEVLQKAKKGINVLYRNPISIHRKCLKSVCVRNTDLHSHIQHWAVHNI